MSSDHLQGKRCPKRSSITTEKNHGHTINIFWKIFEKAYHRPYLRTKGVIDSDFFFPGLRGAGALLRRRPEKKKNAGDGKKSHFVCFMVRLFAWILVKFQIPLYPATQDGDFKLVVSCNAGAQCQSGYGKQNSLQRNFQTNNRRKFPSVFFVSFKIFKTRLLGAFSSWKRVHSVFSLLMWCFHLWHFMFVKKYCLFSPSTKT